MIEVLSNYDNDQWSYFLMVIVIQASKAYTNDHVVKKFNVKLYI